MIPTKKVDSLTDKDIHRFNNQCDRSDGCWEWKGSRIKGRFNYGVFWKNGKHLLVHRISYFLHRGIDPGDNLVLHHCDNPSCVNPAHLFLGTDLDNVRDCIKKNRRVHAVQTGEKNNQSKLTEKAVNLIKERWKNGGIMQKDLARDFNISRASVCMILKGDRWKYLN